MGQTLAPMIEELDRAELTAAVQGTLRASGFTYGQLQAFAIRDDFPTVTAKAAWFAVRDLK